MVDDQLQAAVASANAAVESYAVDTGTNLTKAAEAWTQLDASATAASEKLIERAGQSATAIETMAKRSEQAATHTHGLYRAELAIAHGTELLGHAIGTQNAALGEAITGMGSTVQVVGIATHSYTALRMIIQQTTIAQIALNAVSGPIGWIALGVAAVAAAGAYLLMEHNAEKAAAAQRAFNAAMEKSALLAENLRSMEESTGNPKIDALQDEKHDLAEREKQAEKYLEYQHKHKATADAINAAAKTLTQIQEEQIANAAKLYAAKEKQKVDDEQEAMAKRAEEEATTHSMTPAQKRVYDYKQSDPNNEHPERLARIEEANARLEAQEEALKKIKDAEDDATKAAAKAAKEKEEYGKKVSGLMERLKEETIAITRGNEAKQEAAIRAMHLKEADEKAAIAAVKALEVSKEKKKADEAAAHAAEQHNQAVTHMAQSLAEKMKTPLERYREEWKAIDEAVALHHKNALQGIDDETAARARLAAETEYEKAIAKEKKQSNAHTGQFEDLTSAYRRISSASMAGDDPQKEIAQHTKRTAEAVEKLAGKGEHEHPHSEHRHPRAGMGV